jgi:hypothetical protein
MVEAQVEEKKFNSESFISKNQEKTFEKHNLKFEVRFVEGVYKAYITPLKEDMSEAKITENLKKALTEIGKSDKKEDIKKFNMLMGTLVENADKKTIQKIQNADQEFLKDKFLEKIKKSKVELGASQISNKDKGNVKGETDLSRNVSLITQKELDNWLVEQEISKRKKEGKLSTHETVEDKFGKKLVDDVTKKKSLTSFLTSEEGDIIATTLATGAKGNEEITKKEVTGVVAIIRNYKVEENIKKESTQISDKYKDFKNHSINPVKDKTKFGFYEEEDQLMVRMKHADGEWKDSVFTDKEGNINPETFKDVCYVANIYKNDTNTKSREKNNLSLDQAKEIRKVITETVFKVEGVQEMFDQANEKYKKDRPGYELSRDGVAAGYLYEILKQKK